MLYIMRERNPRQTRLSRDRRLHIGTLIDGFIREYVRERK